MPSKYHAEFEEIKSFLKRKPNQKAIEIYQHIHSMHPAISYKSLRAILQTRISIFCFGRFGKNWNLKNKE